MKSAEGGCKFPIANFGHKVLANNEVEFANLSNAGSYADKWKGLSLSWDYGDGNYDFDELNQINNKNFENLLQIRYIKFHLKLYLLTFLYLYDRVWSNKHL